MTTTLLRAAARIATPWTHGGGSTREIAAWPSGAGLDDFEWRISMAEFHEAGAFSLFPGVDRCLTVIKGRLSLTLNGETSVSLDAQSEPRTFPGDRACNGLPIGGPVLDLNVMSRRGLFRSEVKRVSNATWRPAGVIALLIALESLTAVDDRASDQAIELGALDGLLCCAPSTQTALRIDGPALSIDITAL